MIAQMMIMVEITRKKQRKASAKDHDLGQEAVDRLPFKLNKLNKLFFSIL